LAVIELPNSPLIDAIPDSQSVRLSLAELVRQQALLRSLLKLAQQKESAAQRTATQTEGARRVC
jgi:hypothetical protein